MRVGTWNLLHGRSPTRGVDRGVLAEAAASLDADVLALQEVDRDQRRSGRLDLTGVVARALGAREHRFAPALIGSPTLSFRAAGPGDERPGEPAYGVALVVRVPVLSWHTLHLAPGPLRVPTGRRGGTVRWSGDEPRVALAARIQGPAGPMTVAAVHVSFLPGQSTVHLRRVARWLRTLPGPHLLLGDLNMPPAPARWATGFTSLAAARTFPAVAPRVQLDHVLGLGDLPPARGPRAWRLPVSDHRALTVDLG